MCLCVLVFLKNDYMKTVILKGQYKSLFQCMDIYCTRMVGDIIEASHMDFYDKNA